ncbi:hypothetical protein [Anaerohalosphaera lusitana]|nr:hypothetical protein [Anaerohalosphaera lusitana]
MTGVCLAENGSDLENGVFELSVDERVALQEDRLVDIERLAKSRRESLRVKYDRAAASARRELGVFLERFEDRLEGLSMNDRDLLGLMVRNVADVSDVDRAMRADRYFASATGLLDERLTAGHLLVPVIEKYVSGDDVVDPFAVKLVARVADKIEQANQLEGKMVEAVSRVDAWEKRMKEQVQGIIRQIEAEPGEQRPSVINAIAYNEYGECVMMIGDELVREGDELRGVTVKSISTNKAEFEKNGRSWTQEVGEAANEQW